MKIGVIGTFIKDHIFLSNGTEIDSFGGIFYTVSILGNLVSESDEVYPVCYLGEDIYDDIIGRLSECKGIKITGIKKIAQNNTAVKLIYREQEKRDEYLSNPLPPLNLDHIFSVGKMDAWLVNFITGFEMSLSTFHEFRDQAQGMIHMDFHSSSVHVNDGYFQRRLNCLHNG